MKFEHLIWIIIFLVFVVSVIIKKVRAASRTSEKGIAKRPPEWKEKLKKFMTQAQKMAREGDTLEDLGPIRKEISSERIEQAIEKPPLPKIKPALVKADAESIEPAVSGKEILPKDLEFGIQDLRKAVIWSEILAPPLALRDK
jgi:predicted Holliday junction resolvase-like endonuclease